MTRLLRLENLAVFALLMGAYHLHGGSWYLFAALFLVPDVSFLGYLAGPRIGALCYNALHSWIAPVMVLMAGWLLEFPIAVSVALIWAAHIAFDRALGYGLKHFSGFKDTHLGRIGGGASE